ncbi:hypothetical protein DZJ_13540 [Dickeya ananatis]
MRDTPNSPDRRRFIKTLAITGVAASLPGSLLLPRQARAQAPIPYNPNSYTIFRNSCPRNCYDTCSLKTYVKDGVIAYIDGAKESTFTHGMPCLKGLTYPRRVYSPDRIKYPMIQDGRGSGKWRRISWDEAMERIANKILEIKKKDGSLLGLALTKYSGNLGILNYGVEGMMSSLGYTTRFVGTPCWPAGIDAQSYDMGDMWCNDPEDLAKSKYIIVWGANPAWCSLHSMKYLYQARERGAKVVVIDPILTQTPPKQICTYGSAPLPTAHWRWVWHDICSITGWLITNLSRNIRWGSQSLRNTCGKMSQLNGHLNNVACPHRRFVSLQKNLLPSNPRQSG